MTGENGYSPIPHKRGFFVRFILIVALIIIIIENIFFLFKAEQFLTSSITSNSSNNQTIQEAFNKAVKSFNGISSITSFSVDMIGQVTQITPNAITLKTNNATTNIPIRNNTKFIDQTQASIPISQYNPAYLKQGDYIQVEIVNLPNQGPFTSAIIKITQQSYNTLVGQL